jgi:hypothetical protein
MLNKAVDTQDHWRLVASNQSLGWEAIEFEGTQCDKWGLWILEYPLYPSPRLDGVILLKLNLSLPFGTGIKCIARSNARKSLLSFKGNSPGLVENWFSIRLGICHWKGLSGKLVLYTLKHRWRLEAGLCGDYPESLAHGWFRLTTELGQPHLWFWAYLVPSWHGINTLLCL